MNQKQNSNKNLNKMSYYLKTIYYTNFVNINYLEGVNIL